MGGFPEGSGRVLFVCTGRRTHKRRVLAESRWDTTPDGERAVGFPEFQRGSGGPLYRRGDMQGSAGAYEFRCPSCSRRPWLTIDRAHEAARRAVEADVRVLDVSLL